MTTATNDLAKPLFPPRSLPLAAELRRASLVLLALTVITGLAYPLAVTLVAKVAFPAEAEGSLVRVGGTGRVVGSRLVGQAFVGQRYFWGRPSAGGPTNLGPTNEALTRSVAERVASLRAAHPDRTGPVPADLVTTSASGLDPHISPAAAEYQVARVARARGESEERVRALVASATIPRAFGVLGEPVVDVLALNLALDASP